MQTIINAIYQEIDDLYSLSEALHGVWASSIAEREFNRNYSDSKNVERTNYQLRIEFNGITFRIRWFEVKFVRNGSRTIRISNAISIPESGRCKKNQFSKAQDWELLIIERMEDSFVRIRNQLKHLGKAHNSIIWASKSSNETLEVKEIKYRVSKNTRSIKAAKEKLSNR